MPKIPMNIQSRKQAQLQVQQQSQAVKQIRLLPFNNGKQSALSNIIQQISVNGNTSGNGGGCRSCGGR